MISIREAARRLGVSDTAVHKAIKTGRISEPDKSGGGRAVLNWKKTEAQWHRNSSEAKRSHVGSRGGKLRANDEPQSLQVSAKMGEPVGGRQPAEPADQDGGVDETQSYAQARAARERYNAELARIELEEKTGKLVNADDAVAQWAKHISSAKTRIMGIPAACKSRYSDLPLAVVAVIEKECRAALEDLANGVDQ